MGVGVGGEARNSNINQGHHLWLVSVVLIACLLRTEVTALICLDVWGAWQCLSSVALHHVSREMRGRRTGPGIKGQSWALSELISSYRRLNPLTLRCAVKKLCWLIWNSKGRLFIVNVRLLKLEQREEQGGERTPARLVFASESCKPLRKRVILSLFFLLLKTEAFLRIAFPRSAK